jgi:hypothetical protein
MEVVVQPSGGFAIFEEAAAGFTYLNLTAQRAAQVLVQEARLPKEQAEAAVAAPAATWDEKVARIREIFRAPDGAHPCVAAALKKALESRLNALTRAFGQVKDA